MKNSSYKSLKALPKPPKHLSKEAQSRWNRLVGEWEFGEDALLLLESGLECLDRMRQAQSQLAAEGITLVDRFGQRKQHPAVLTECACKAMLLRYVKALGLDLEQTAGTPGRPAGVPNFPKKEYR